MAGEKHGAAIGKVSLTRRDGLQSGALELRVRQKPEGRHAERGQSHHRGNDEPHETLLKKGRVRDPPFA